MDTRDCYWTLFWQTGLPAAWLLSRLRETGERAAAFAPRERGGAPV